MHAVLAEAPPQTCRFKIRMNLLYQRLDHLSKNISKSSRLRKFTISSCWHHIVTTDISGPIKFGFRTSKLNWGKATSNINTSSRLNQIRLDPIVPSAQGCIFSNNMKVVINCWTRRLLQRYKCSEDYMVMVSVSWQYI